jgi:hypothetical protein
MRGERRDCRQTARRNGVNVPFYEPVGQREIILLTRCNGEGHRGIDRWRIRRILILDPAGTLHEDYRVGLSGDATYHARNYQRSHVARTFMTTSPHLMLKNDTGDWPEESANFR